MKINRVHIKNFRLLKDLELNLEEDLSLIIGKNNCGKTSLLSILDKFIGSKANTISFSYDDFNIEFQKEIKQWVESDKVNEDISMGISLTLFVQYDRTDNLSNISKLMLDLDPNNNNIVIKFEYTLLYDGVKRLRNDYAAYKDNQTNKKIEKSMNDFLKDNHKKYFKIMKKSISYNPVTLTVNDNEFIDILKENISLDKIISYKMISARRNVTNSDSDKTLSTLSSKYYEKKENGEVESEKIQEFKDALSATDTHLDQIYEGLFKNVIDKVKKFGGVKEGDSIIKIASTLHTKDLLNGNTTVLYDYNSDQTLPENYNGLGYLNLISMIFEIEILLSEFRMEAHENEVPADMNILFIEEPEAHTHPQMQYIFIRNIKDILSQASKGEDGRVFNLQTIMTTHSSHITSESDFEKIKYFYKTRDHGVISKNLKDLESQYKEEGHSAYYKFLKQYLTLNRAELFFADKAIFIEGDTEKILLPAMMKKIDQENKDNPLLSQNISIVEVGAHSHIFEKFIDFIGVKSLIITDIDFAKISYNTVAGKMKKELKKCEVKDKEANFTTNYSLQYFFNSSYEYLMNNANEAAATKESGTQSGNSLNLLSFLINLDLRGKQLRKDKDSKKWVQDGIHGNVLIVYQTEEVNSNHKKYHARSFEDSFFHLNRQFIVKNKERFESSLKNIEYFEKNKNSYILAEKCVKKKPNLAMDILINSEEKDDKHFLGWDIPSYIKEGLLWLKHN